MQKLVEFESFTNSLEQYGRRNNIISSGIPESVDNNQLEESVTETLIDIDVNVDSSDIEACHRIGKQGFRNGSTKTSIRFVNRKHAKLALYNKNPSNSAFTSENLTRMNESLAHQGRKLKGNSLVNVCYARDGIVTI